MSEPALPRRLAALALAFALGLLVGGVGSFAQADRLGGVPVGLVLSLLASAAAVVAVTVLGSSRGLPVSAVLGWLVAVVPLAGSRREGDVVVAGDSVGYAWAYGGMLLVCATCVVVVARLLSHPGTGG